MIECKQAIELRSSPHRITDAVGRAGRVKASQGTQGRQNQTRQGDAAHVLLIELSIRAHIMHREHIESKEYVIMLALIASNECWCTQYAIGHTYSSLRVLFIRACLSVGLSLA